MNKNMNTVVFVDEPYHFDKRVINSIALYEKKDVFEFKKSKKTSINAPLWLAIKAFYSIKAFKIFLKLENKHSHSGYLMLSSWFLAIKELKKKDFNYDCYHAHDLYCAYACIKLLKKNDYFVYDAHELELHRNRKTSYARFICEYYMEKVVLKRANKVIVVNLKIAEIMADYYAYSLQKFHIVYNNWYEPLNFKTANVGKPALIYIGSGLQGRMLEDISHTKDLDVYICPFESSLNHLENSKNWHILPDNYQEEFYKIAQSQRAMMWCCLETESLSYKVATPNKFFQSMAIGMPIIAAKNTYLAAIVKHFNIGAIYDGTNLNAIIEDIQKPLYELYQNNILQLRDRINNGEKLF